MLKIIRNVCLAAMMADAFLVVLNVSRENWGAAIFAVAGLALLSGALTYFELVEPHKR